MKFDQTKLSGAYIIEPEIHTDERGGFFRYFCKNEFNEINFNFHWVQINHSISIKTGTLRGLHFQVSPYSEIKLIKCIKGSVFDVIVDIRKDSDTFLKWFGIELSETNKKMIYVPQGFAHGFQTLEDNTELIYHHSEFYMPGYESGILHNDPLLNINWPLPVSIISQRDLNHQTLDSL